MQTVDFSHSGQYLLTCSTDNTACLWTTGSSEPILPFKCQNQAVGMSSKVGHLNTGVWQMVYKVKNCRRCYRLLKTGCNNVVGSNSAYVNRVYTNAEQLLSFTETFFSNSEWGSTQNVLMIVLHWSKQISRNCTHLLPNTRSTHTVKIFSV